MSEAWASIAELLALQEAGELSAVDIVVDVLHRIEVHDPGLNCYVRCSAEAALAAAESVDRRRRAGEPLGPLAGVPVALKDNFLIAGVETTCCSRILQGFVPPVDGTHTRRLKEADAVLLGKLNMDEFAMGSSNETSVYGPVLNPWDPGRVPGGSSGGSAAAVAAGLSTVALGSDTGGSIRQPASFCGVVGLRPTYGRVSRSGLVAFASSLDQAGPLGRSVEDCARVLQVIGGHDPADSTSCPEPQPDYVEACSRGIEGIRAGLPREYFGEGPDPQVEQRVREAIAHLEGLGVRVRELSLPHTRFAVATHYLVAPAEASSNLARYDGVRYARRCEEPRDLDDLYSRSRAEGFGPEVTRRIMLGTYALSAGYYDQLYLKATKLRTLIRKDFLDAFEQVDVLLCPTAPSTAFALGAKLDDPLQMYLQDVYTVPGSLAGLPGMSLPCGFDEQGLPVGMQVLAAPFAEETLLALAGAYEATTEHHLCHPKGF